MRTPGTQNFLVISMLGLSALLSGTVNSTRAQEQQDAPLPDTASVTETHNSQDSQNPVNAESNLFTPAEQLDDAQSRFLSYYSDGLYADAAAAAMQTVQLAREIYGQTSLEAGLALANLATAQSKQGDLPAALANYETSVNLIEKHEGIISPRLVSPLMGLASSYNAMGAYDRGLKFYKRALRISHVDNGLNNSEQMPIRDGLTESYLGLGDMDRADFQQQAQLEIMRREHPDDLEMLMPAIYKLAEWYQRSNQPEREALLLQSSLRTIQQASGSDSTRQIRTLRELASAYQRLEMPAEAIRTLKRAWRLNENSAATDPLLSADIQVEIGDFYNAFGDLKDARRYYTGAWQILVSDTDNAALLEKYFALPVNIWSLQLPTIHPQKSKTSELYLTDPDQFESGTLRAQYDINENGRVENIRITESDPEGLLDKKIIYLLGRYYYRPRFVNGEPALTKDLQLTHYFSYLPDEPDTDAAGQASKQSDDRLEYPDSSRDD